MKDSSKRSLIKRKNGLSAWMGHYYFAEQIRVSNQRFKRSIL